MAGSDSGFSENSRSSGCVGRRFDTGIVEVVAVSGVGSGYKVASDMVVGGGVNKGVAVVVSVVAAWLGGCEKEPG